MIAETRFVAAEDGSAWTEEFSESGVDWFRFVTHTTIALETGPITIRTNRRMHAGLHEYFKRNEAWRKRILGENQGRAIAFFESGGVKRNSRSVKRDDQLPVN